MNTFSWHFWREWREHRFALITLAVVLPLGTWLLGLPLSRSTVNDPLFHAAASLAFAIVALVVVGGELLGSERRGTGLSWLERLPSGLAVAFRAKLAFFLVTMTFVALYGYGAGWLVGCLRPAHTGGRAGHDLLLFQLLEVVLALWTFAASAWALRGGLSLLAAALILAVIGYPIWRVIDAGYQPNVAEMCTIAMILVPGALVSAWLAFVCGARLGRGTLSATLYGLAPTLPMLALAATWSSLRLGEREIFDPLAVDFRIGGRLITQDGRTAFVIGSHQPGNWARDAMPQYVVRVDLERGSFEKLGRFVFDSGIARFEDEHGPRDAYALTVEEHDQPLVFDAANGEPLAWDPQRKLLDGWYFQGLGLYVRPGKGKPNVIRDPFRGRDYPLAEFGDYSYWSELLVRPGKWLCAPSRAVWNWLDPDTKERSAVDWPEHSRPLVLFTDGRILLATEHELRLVNPEQGTSVVLDTCGIQPAHIQRNWSGLRVPNASWDATTTSGTIVLQTSDHAWLVLDEEATSVRRLPVPDDVQFLKRVGASTAIVEIWNDSRIARLDLANGQLTPLWPPARADGGAAPRARQPQ